MNEQDKIKEIDRIRGKYTMRISKPLGFFIDDTIGLVKDFEKKIEKSNKEIENLKRELKEVKEENKKLNGMVKVSKINEIIGTDDSTENNSNSDSSSFDNIIM